MLTGASQDRAGAIAAALDAAADFPAGKPVVNFERGVTVGTKEVDHELSPRRS